MKKLFSILFSFAVICGKAQVPSFQWAKGLLATDKLAVSYGKSIAVDAGGNTYITGDFEGTVDFDPGTGVYNLTIAPPQDNIYILKLDASGNFVWVKDIVAVSGGTGRSINVDAAGNIYSTGYFKGTIDFDPGAGVATLVADSNISAYILKLDSSGNFVWAKNIGGNSAYNFTQALCLDMDASGNIYITGYFNGTVDFDPGVGVADLIGTSGGQNSFVSKFDNSGNFIWASGFGGISAVSASSIAVDAFGNVYTTGYFSQTADFNPGAGVFNLVSTPMGISLYISKLDPLGNFIWAKAMGGSSGADAAQTYAIVIDAANNVYTTGEFEGTVDFDPGAGTANLTSPFSYDMFISKLDASGNFMWVKNVDETGTGNSRGSSLVLDALGNIYATGQFGGTGDFDPGAGVMNLTALGFDDAFVLKLDAAGNFVWGVRNGGGGVTSSDTRGQSLTLDAALNIYSVGIFQGNVDFDFTSGVFNIPTMGAEAIYVQKIHQSDIPLEINNFSSDNTISIYPNPTSNAINIIMKEAKLSHIMIINVLGEVVYSMDIKTAKTKIDISNFQNGIYFIQVQTNNGTTTEKIIKQ